MWARRMRLRLRKTRFERARHSAFCVLVPNSSFHLQRRDLAQSGLQSLVVWALSDNEPAVGFYRALRGKAVARSSERFGTRVLDKVAFAWNS